MTRSAQAFTSIGEVLADPPLVHDWMSTDGPITHGLLPDALSFIEATVTPGARTLETGSGLSTIAFALAGAHHTCVVPDETEPQRIRAYCAERGIDTTTVGFEVAMSEDVLPHLPLKDLDVVLIDGSHSFPQVFIDWFYTQRALKVGGVLVIDDVHIWTGRVLRDFLDAEPEWSLTHRWAGRTVAFRKLAETGAGRDWSDQRYVMRRTMPKTVGRARMAAGLVRSGDFRELGRRVGGIAKGRNR